MNQPLLRHGDAELPLNLQTQVQAGPAVAEMAFAGGAARCSDGNSHPRPPRPARLEPSRRDLGKDTGYISDAQVNWVALLA